MKLPSFFVFFVPWLLAFFAIKFSVIPDFSILKRTFLLDFYMYGHSITSFLLFIPFLMIKKLKFNPCIIELL